MNKIIFTCYFHTALISSRHCGNEANVEKLLNINICFYQLWQRLNIERVNSSRV